MKGNRESPFQVWAIWQDNKGFFVSGHDTKEEADAALAEAIEEDVGMFDNEELGFGEFAIVKVMKSKVKA